MLRKLLSRLLSSDHAPVARDPSPAPRDEAADRLIAEGNLAEGAGRVEEACERYREAVQAAPGYAKAHLNLGIGLEAAGAAEPAIHSYEAALAIDPLDPFAAYNLGKLLYTRGVPEEAERLLRKALESRPEFPEAQVVLSRVLESQGNLGTAAAALEAVRSKIEDYFARCLLAEFDARALAAALQDEGIRIVSGGTDSHLVLADVRPLGTEGKTAEIVLDEVQIAANKNQIPFDPNPPSAPSGIRLGTPACSTLGMDEPEMREIGSIIGEVLRAPADRGVKEKARGRVGDLMARFPLYA